MGPVASTPVEVSTTSTSTLSGVPSNKLEVSTAVEVSTSSETGGATSASGAGGRGGDGVGLDLQKKLLTPRALKACPRVEQGG
jgi:hypothetical protein